MRPSLDLVALVAANSARVAPDLVEPLARFMTTARKLCRGDFDKVLLMLVVVLRSNSHPGFKLAAESLVGDETGALPSFGTNARSLAESTGIPRETVRRKVREMVDDGWVIRMDVHDTERGIEITLEAPGVDQKDVKISVEDNVLTVSGEKKSEAERKEQDRRISERVYGAFSRSVVLPSSVEADKIVASMDKGVLKIVAPKNGKAQAKTIAIQSAH